MTLSPYFPRPSLPHAHSAILAIPARAGACKAAVLLNCFPHQPRGTSLLCEATYACEALKGGWTMEAGSHWLLVASDRSAVFADKRPSLLPPGHTLRVRPVLVRLAQRFTADGITRSLAPLDFTDPLENPTFPNTFAHSFRQALQTELDAWDEACQQTLPSTCVYPAPQGSVPRWFGTLASPLHPRITTLESLCAGLALMALPHDRDRTVLATIPHVALLGATLDSTGRLHPPTFVLAKTPKHRHPVLDAANAALAVHPDWPRESLVAQSGSWIRTKRSTIAADTIASSITVPWPTSTHEVITLIALAKTTLGL